MCDKDCFTNDCVYIGDERAIANVYYCKDCFESIAPQNLLEAMKLGKPEYPQVPGSPVRLRDRRNLNILSFESICNLVKGGRKLQHLYCHSCCRCLADTDMEITFLCNQDNDKFYDCPFCSDKIIKRIIYD
jgi:hypothetical protein